jgi:predicted RNase H-like HicB family nuclease
MENIREAIEGYLESLWKHGDPLLIREAGMTVDEFARLL